MQHRLADIHIQYLADVPKYIPILAEWIYAAWGKYDPTLNLNIAIESLKNKINIDKIPLTFVAMDDSKPIGMISLKPKIKLAGYEDRKIWLGGFLVTEEYRHIGVGTLLLNTAYAQAKKLGYDKISVFASDPQAAQWYATRGWNKFATASYQGYQITLLEIQV